MIQPYPFFLLRRPAYSLDLLARLHAQTASQPLGAVLRAWYGSDPLVQQAIYVASPALHDRCQRWLADGSVSDADKLTGTLHKYLIRMCTRATPYGLFAGCAIGTLADRTTLQPSPDPARQHTRLDIEALLALKDFLIQQPAIREQVRVYPNSTLYPVGESLRYVEQQRENDQRQYFVSSVGADAHLKALFTQAKTGVTLGELRQGLVQFGAAPDVADDYLNQLIDSQLLVYEIEPTVTGEGYFDRLLDRLSDLSGIAPLLVTLRDLQTVLRQPTGHLAGYRALRDFFADPAMQPAGTDLIQVDLAYPADTCQLGRSAVRILQRQITALLVLNQSQPADDLSEFKRRFYDRYENEEVPLAYALDHECGVGYGDQSTLGMGYAPLIDGLSIPGSKPGPDAGGWDWWQTFALDKYTEALRHAQPEIVLTDADLTTIGQQRQAVNLPASFYVFGTLLAPDAAAIDRGEFVLNLLAAQGPSAVNLMSRFCAGNPDLTRQVQQCALDEEAHHPDVIIAEVVHFPESRAGNILTRPTLHTHEIPYMGQASVPPAQQIELTDLLVSVHRGQVVLRSKRLNKRVVPRLSSAHNYRHGLPIYRFLCDLQYQDAQLSIGWPWGRLQQQPYLPRVRYRNIILSRATWLLRRSDLPEKQLATWPAILTTAGLPGRFLLTDADNELLIDVQVPDTLRLLDMALKKQASLRVVECLAGPERCPVRGSDGAAFTHELILPCRNATAPAMLPLPGRSEELPQRRFSIGSEWLYLKVYTGEKVADTLLVHDLYPVIEQLLKTQIISQFHFVRYKDRDPHLRLRFRGNPHVEFYHYTIRAVERALHPHVERGEVHKIQTDTYQRELERYGRQRINLCEGLFHADSLSTLQFLAQTGETFDENLRFGFAIHKIDLILNANPRTARNRNLLISDLKERFFQEFGGDPALRHQLNDRYRAYRPLIEQALSRPFALLNGQENWMAQQQTLIARIDEATPDPTLLYSITDSLIHMSINRLFPSKQRAYELVLYHCLAKYYNEVRAKATPAPVA
jgi:lantibiotic biosynthesis protein